MKMVNLTSAELTTKLRGARGAKRRCILAELQRRYDETVPRVLLGYHPSFGATYSRRYDFALIHGSSISENPCSSVAKNQESAAR